MILTITLVVLAAFFDAVKDATENEPNFNESILKNLNKRFWLKSVSWASAKKIAGYKLDAWHIAKTLGICCWVWSIVNALDFNSLLWNFLIFAGLGVIWNIGFVGFYHGIFKVK